MAKFAWQGKTRSGDTRKGVMDAEDQEAVENRLRAEGINPTKIRQGGGGGGLNFGTGVTKKDIVIFTRQLATMIDAGLPLVQCLDILANQSENKNFARVLMRVKASVESGNTFSDALRRHPKVFDDLYVNLIAAGEIGGILDTILNRLGTYIEKAEKLKRQVKGAMTYPISILVIALLVVIVLLSKVIPVFENMFREMKAGALPAPTQVVINISNGFLANWYIIFGIGAGVMFAFTAAIKTEKGREIFDSFLLKMPLIGTVLRKVAVARFTRTLGTLLSSGVPILDSLDICARTSGNVIVERAVLYAKEKISEGRDLAGPLQETKIFPTMVVQMIGVGEQTGAMDAMLSKIADFYDDEVDVAVSALTSMMEPFMMCFLGGIIGGLIVSMYLPIFELAGSIKSD